jgi:cell division septation protein DedD
MHGAFDEEQLLIQQPRSDTEVTLGPLLIFLLVAGLVLVCGLSYGLGYAVGRHAKPEAAVAATPQPVSTTAATTSTNSLPKPSASPQGQQRTTASQPPADSGDQEPASSHDAEAAPPLTAAAATPSQSAAPAGALMVQIAAVAHQEDADVLLGALRKRGYKVSVHRDPADGLLHVRLGPFSNRDVAGKWRDKLLNDGYNALVQP